MPKDKKQKTRLLGVISVLLRPCVLLVFQLFFWRSLFYTFRDFGILRVFKIDAFWVTFEDFLAIG